MIFVRVSAVYLEMAAHSNTKRYFQEQYVTKFARLWKALGKVLAQGTE